jgi:NAD(P)-dependent dehydrogenase (short-subunit alcohol dehydrogenase family)
VCRDVPGCFPNCVSGPGYFRVPHRDTTISQSQQHRRTSIPPVTTLQRYSDRRVLITGGGSGIGQATVLRILAEGGRVVAADISESGLKDTVAKAEPHRDRLSTVVIDVASEQSVKEGVAQGVEALGGLDALVNAAGILRSAHFMDTTLADFEQVIRINLIGTFLVTRECIPALRNGNDPAVVNFSSTSATFAHPYMSAYAASKAGVQAMTHALALEFAKERIRFNSVQPGSISSGMTDGTGESKQSIGPGLPADADFSLFGKITPVLPLDDGGMFAKPDAVAAVVAMLGSSDAYFVTGTEVRIDGGTHM